MKNNSLNNTQLGGFVLVGLVLFIAALYLIGSKQNLFNRTVRVSATFYDVNGLMVGNTVRYSGIDIGTIKEIHLSDDTTVQVIMLIRKDAQVFVRKNALASIGTDGLMGNKLINIHNRGGKDRVVEEGDVLSSARAVETDAMLRTLDKTNENLSGITSDIKKITEKVNNSKTLWTLLTDTTVAENVKASIVNLRATTNNTVRFTRELNEVVSGNSKSGLAAYLLHDSAAVNQFKATMKNLGMVSLKANETVTDLRHASLQLTSGHGIAQVLLRDSSAAADLHITLKQLRSGSALLNEDLEGLKHSFLLRRYFRKLAYKKRDSIR